MINKDRRVTVNKKEEIDKSCTEIQLWSHTTKLFKYSIMMRLIEVDTGWEIN